MRGDGTASPPQRLLLATVAICCAATLLTGPFPIEHAAPLLYEIFERLFFFNDYAGSLAMLAGLVLATAWPKLQDAATWTAKLMGEHPAKTSAIAFVTFAAGAQCIYLAHPLSMDEYAPLMQAHALAHGQLTAHYPAALLDSIVPPWFQGNFVLVNHATGEAMSAYWPGFALLMAPFARLEVTWCLNPAVSALTLLLIHRIASDAATNRAAGGWAMLATLASPQFTVNAMSFYAMPSLLMLNLLFLFLLMKPDRSSAFAAGLVGGLALVMHNPIPHALLATPSLIWLVADRARRRRVIYVLAGYLPPALLLGFGWPLLASWLGMEKPRAAAVAGGFVAEWADRVGRIFVVPNASLLTARWYATWKMWIWACPGLPLLLLIQRPYEQRERLLIAAFALTFLFYLFVRFDQGHGWGYRYIHPVWGVLPIVAGVWFVSASNSARKWGAATLAAGVLATPVFLWQTRSTIEDALSHRLAASSSDNWVIFVTQLQNQYSGDLVQNPPGRSHLLYLVSRGVEQDRALMANHFPQAVEVTQDVHGSAWKMTSSALSSSDSSSARPSAD